MNPEPEAELPTNPLRWFHAARGNGKMRNPSSER